MPAEFWDALEESSGRKTWPMHLVAVSYLSWKLMGRIDYQKLLDEDAATKRVGVGKIKFMIDRPKH
ncbi:MAG TPA: hypothetical protein VFH39_04545 [Candidatus Saccharimonadales bacterium]|nr:hypothetical protein [Candidatus Saccharimonadales bacterium]